MKNISKAKDYLNVKRKQSADANSAPLANVRRSDEHNGIKPPQMPFTNSIWQTRLEVTDCAGN